MAAVTVRDMLFAYVRPREAYERFTSMGVNRQQARNAVALLYWLEQATDVPALSRVKEFNAHSILCLTAEANSVLDCLRRQPNCLTFPEIPFISTLCDNAIDPGIFVFQQDLAVHCIVAILDGVGPLVFNDHLYHRFGTGLCPRFPELEAPYAFCSWLAAGGFNDANDA